jgi:dethiobiotin synthetase
MAKYSESLDLCYWKPIQTGPRDDWDTARLIQRGIPESRVWEPLYSYPLPASPHFAASEAGDKIDPDLILAIYKNWESETSNSRGKRSSEKMNSTGIIPGVPPEGKKLGRKLILEPAGGVMVPITKSVLTVDWIAKFNLPVILVVSTELGTINHSLLSLEALRNREIPVLGFFGSGPDSGLWDSSKSAIEDFSGIPCLGRYFDPVSADALDPDPNSESENARGDVSSDFDSDFLTRVCSHFDLDQLIGKFLR